MSSRKRKHFNVEEKSRIISKLENGATNKDLAKEYDVSHSTISTIWKERNKIKFLFDSNLLKMKRARTTKHIEIEKALLMWFQCQNANNVLLTGPILQQKANDFARCLGDQDFICSSSWIQRFRARHNINVSRKNYVKASCVSIGAVEGFSDTDNSITAPVTDYDIVAEIKKETDEQDETQIEEQFTLPSLNEGLYAFSVLEKIIMCNNQLERGNFKETLVKMKCELLNTSAPVTEDDIIAKIKEKSDKQDEVEQFTVPSLNEGLYAISVLRKIIICNDQFQSGNFEETLVKMQCELLNTYERLKCYK